MLKMFNKMSDLSYFTGRKWTQSGRTFVSPLRPTPWFWRGYYQKQSTSLLSGQSTCTEPAHPATSTTLCALSVGPNADIWANKPWGDSEGNFTSAALLVDHISKQSQFPFSLNNTPTQTLTGCVYLLHHQSYYHIEHVPPHCLNPSVAVETVTFSSPWWEAVCETENSILQQNVKMQPSCIKKVWRKGTFLCHDRWW